MATSGILSFHACHNSGVVISPLGEGIYDHLGFFGLNGPTDAIIVEDWNDSTWVVNASGVRNPATWDALVNNKWIDASGCSSSGMPRVNVADYQDWDHVPSGTLQIWFRASGEMQFSTYNAKLYAYDNTGATTDAPQGIHLEGFEINPSGALIDDYSVTEWSSIDSVLQGINFIDHSPATKYLYDTNEHLWYCAISARADAVGFIDDWDVCFVFQFA